MVEVKIFSGLRRHVGGKHSLNVDAKNLRELFEAIPISRDEVGLVLINRSPVESVWEVEQSLKAGDLVEIYPIVGGG
jgi:molybdopterin converting factor small subunit